MTFASLGPVRSADGVPLPAAPVLDVRCSLPAAPAASGGARHWVAGHLRRLDVSDGARGDVEIVVGELVSNVLHHTDAQVVGVRLAVGVTVTVAVLDDDVARPVLHDLSSDGVTGRGMQIVESLSQSWGVSVTGRGKTVWASLPLGSQ